ncbi:MAG TPA: DUF502 domain-containing protein [Steroidobacteraceae bacterium]|nr:DUF502 domain-containing protein [Steroidobacteraceae bacterium]
MTTPAIQKPGPALQPGQAAPKKKGSPLRRALVAGVLVWLPIIATLWVVSFLFHLADDTLLLLPLPPGYQPRGLMGLALPALGAVFVLIILLLTGFLGTNLLGRRLLIWGEELLQHIPIVGSVYGGVKSFAESVFSQSNSFRKVVMVEYPREGVWSLGFLTAEDVPEVTEKTGEPHACVYISAALNATGGFLAILPRRQIVELDMSVDAAMKMIITCGVVVPPAPDRNRKPELAKPAA